MLGGDTVRIRSHRRMVGRPDPGIRNRGIGSPTGSGIPDQLKDVFKTLFTTKPQATGLGLSIAGTIIETYGGRIWAENRLGGGAVFRFTLPLAKTQTA